MPERICWAVLAAVHLPPALALAMPALIRKLYGIAEAGPAFPLLHHRAALFLVIALICVWAAFEPGVRRLAAVSVALSMISFLAIYVSASQPPSLRGIALADLAALPFLGYAAWRAFTAG